MAVAIAAVYFVLSVGATMMFRKHADRLIDGPRLRAIWAEGLTAEARCTGIRVEEGQDAEGGFVVHRHPTLEFRTDDGRTVSFEERQGRLSPAVGDVVTVHYSAADPEGATTRGPSFVMLHLRGLVLGVCGFFALTAAVVAVVA
ncbi:DUF3592 domain-containing protein [Streptomyces sp. NPDC092952]|uniref:DUF3592 domain-containing protein n=1 Tax=Streptomyces sp. NPDC092952 TaxID=3366018 RepID=UPI00381C0898